MLFFTPSWLKKAQHLCKAAGKFIHSNRDLIPEEKLGPVQELHAAYVAAVKAKDKAEVERLEPDMLKRCEGAVPGYQNSAVRENVEVIIVAIIVALGIRAYFLQPFKIPTASMQPTLNGITAGRMEAGDAFPNPVVRAFQYVARGRNYVEYSVPGEWGPVNLVGVAQESKAHFFTSTTLIFEGGGVQRSASVYAPARQIFETLWNGPGKEPGGFLTFGVAPQALGSGDDTFRFALATPAPVKAGLLLRGYVDTGDQVLVDKVSYHFRRPERGEVFVFSTRDIARIKARTPEGFGSQHYIKRLAGLPGDSFHVEPPRLFINGEVAKEEKFQRVMTPSAGGYPGYVIPRPDSDDFMQGPGDTVVPPHSYLAMGDNSPQSFDGRNWGPVPERNLVGPALFVYWPFQPHWGFIR